MSQPEHQPEWMPRAHAALKALLSDPVLWAQVRTEVDAFFAAHPDEPRNEQSHELMTVLVFERLTSAPNQQPQQTQAA